MAIRHFEHVAATSLAHAVQLGADPGTPTAVVAGGTDLLGVLKDNIHARYPARLVDLKPLAGLRGITAKGHGVRIGALTTLAAVARDAGVRARFPALSQAARVVASPQIRNMGTVGGNLCQEPRCWYYRAPENRFFCLRKGGDHCGAVLGDNRYHSIFGASGTALPACATNCPARVAIPTYLGQIRAGHLDAAARLLLERNPLPAITGRVCPHFCQSHCNRGTLDEPVSTRAIERHLGDHVLAHARTLMPPPGRRSGKRVAVVGAGPGGLSAAYYLRQAGHAVTVFDRMPAAGGMLRYCIPAYRLPQEVVAQQVAALAGMGIEFVLGAEIGGSKTSLRRLRREYDGVFLATGAWRHKTLGLEREELLRSGLDFLIDVARGQRAAPGKKVLVIGGGSVAVDVAISALRLGAREVTMACLEGRAVMPAIPEDIEQALEEKIRLLPGWGPHRVLTKGGRLAGLDLKRCTSVFDRDGRFRPTFDPATTMTVAADCVLLAIGQGADLGYAGRALATAGGLLVTDADTQATSLAGVFAGGDAVSGPATVIAAIAAGRRAAVALGAMLGGRPARAGARPRAVAPHLDVNVAALTSSPAVRAVTRAPAVRTIDAEDTATLDLRAIETEARRCVNCGCVAVNASDLAPALVALGARIETTTRTLAAEDFFGAGRARTTVLAPGELVTAITIPAPPPGSVQSYLKFRVRNAIDFPIVGVAMALQLHRGRVKAARIALGAVAPLPLRAHAVEQFLIGRALDEETAAVASRLAVQEVQPLAHNTFKVTIVQELLRRALLGLPAR